MRSRYAAFVKRDVSYLFRTLHHEHPNKVRGEQAFTSELKRHFALRIAYRKLVVLDSAPADAQGVSRVLFVAHLSERGRDLSFAELSLFARDEGNLRYLAGHTMSLSELGGRTRIGEFAQ
jgi:SEC-C motif-containing protein